MSLSNKHRIAIGACILAGAALSVDRFVIGYEVDPTIHNESDLIVAAKTSGKANTVRSVPGVEKGMSIADRLERLLRPSDADESAVSEAMVIPASWKPSKGGVEASGAQAATTDAPAAPELHMTLVIRATDGRALAAIVNGTRIPIGGAIGGYTLQRIEQGTGVVLHGVFEGPSGVIRVPLASNPDLPTIGAQSEGGSRS